MHQRSTRSPEETQRLWIEFKKTNDPAVREQIILQYAPLVKYVLGRIAVTIPDILESEDILSYGTIGLITAVERFDPTVGVKFETYAIARIRGSIIDELRSLDWIPRSARQRVREITQAMSELEVELQRRPSDEEVAERVGVGVESYRSTLTHTAVATFSLDRPVEVADESEPISVGDVIADDSSPDPSVEAEMRELEDELTGAIEHLPERERLLLSLYYHEDLTMKEISQVLDISESRVCQIHARAVLKLRAHLETRGHARMPA